MTNRETVIGRLNEAEEYFRDCRSNASFGSKAEEHFLELQSAMREAAERLKAQEPVLLENQHKPYGHFTNTNSPWISRCPKCGKKIEGKQTRFCKYCGQAVKWE